MDSFFHGICKEVCMHFFNNRLIVKTAVSAVLAEHFLFSSIDNVSGLLSHVFLAGFGVQ